MSIEIKECDKCGDEMVMRSGRYGSFWGCNAYPECTNKEKLTPEDQQQVNIPTNGQTISPINTKSITRKELFIGFALCAKLIKHSEEVEIAIDAAMDIGELMEEAYIEKQNV